MVKKELSNKAKKRLQKEEDLLESSWKLADNMYSSIWNDRWTSIKSSILADSLSIELINGYTDISFVRKDEFKGQWEKYKGLEYRMRDNVENLENSAACEVDQEGLTILKCLGVQTGEKILDMYSNTESTTMYLLQLLHKENLSLTINQSIPDKYQKLRKQVYEIITKSVESQVRLTGWDPIKFGTAETHSFDRVLIDVPCSNERKVFNNEKLMKKWTDKVSRQNAKKQLLLLISALAATRPGGTVLFVSRCLTPYETDEIIEKALKKSRTEPQILKLSLSIGESTSFGWRILPDSNTFGPLYLSKLLIPE